MRRNHLLLQGAETGKKQCGSRPQKCDYGSDSDHYARVRA
jgi:hypothetical protein